MKETNTVRAHLREAFQSIHRIFVYFNKEEILLELLFEDRCFYWDLTVPVVHSSRSPEALHVCYIYKKY
jgi:hypothetical protein